MCDIDRPVTLVSHAATCLDEYLFKYFFACSSANNSSGIGSSMSGSSGSTK